LPNLLPKPTLHLPQNLLHTLYPGNKSNPRPRINHQSRIIALFHGEIVLFLEFLLGGTGEVVLEGLVDDCAAVVGCWPGGFAAEEVVDTGSGELVRYMMKLRGLRDTNW